MSKRPGLKVIKLEFILKLKIKCNDWLLADTLAARGHVSASSQALHFILSLRLYSSFITSRPGLVLHSKLHSEIGL